MAHDDGSHDSIFCGAIEIASSEERDAFIARACGSDAELRRQVTRLVDAHFQAGSFLESPPESATLSAGSAPSTEVTGVVIGPYKLLQEIGEGGMGTVYMAEQAQPVRRTVALKLIKAGMDSRQVLARFGAERQALALMDHPNIAKVFDAGTTDAGRPYFVMELVKGIPITKFCDERRLTLRERLELAIPVCQAVQHAHQKGIIHRDLKPSNVLIALYDGKPVPKVIDFGVAKATGSRLTDETLYTEFGAVVGTLEYMSPEQAELNQLDIDTRSDIYSLGVLLYELLTGSTPLERKRLNEVLFLEILRVIREDESPRPSMRLSTTEGLASIAACRNIEPRRLSGLVRGELDWIVMKALEKDRNRRYETANGLAADLRRYLDDEAVQACPPSVRYRLSKIARKHRAALATTAALALMLLLGTTVSAWQAFVATRAQAAAIKAEGIAREERDRAIKAEGQASSSAKQAQTEAAIARAVNQFLQKDLLAEAAPKQNARDRQVTVEELLNKAAARIAGKFDDNPAVEAAIRQTVGDAYMELGLYTQGQPHMERALELRRRELGPEHRETLTSMNNLAALYEAQGQYEKAERLFTQALDAHRRLLGIEHPDTLKSMNNMAFLYEGRGQYEKAEPMYLQMLEVKRRVLGAEHPETLKSMNNLAALYAARGQVAKAETLHVQALEINRRVLGAEHPDTLMSMSNLGKLFQGRGQYEKAEPLLTQSLEASRRVLGPEHPHTLASISNLAILYHSRGQYEKAEPLHTQALELRRRVLGLENPATITSMNNLAALYQALGQYEKAEPLFAQALELSRRVLGAEHPGTLTSLNNLGLLYRNREQYEKAEPLLTQALEIQRRALGPEHPSTLITLNNLALVYDARRQYEIAEPLFTKAMEVERRVLGLEHPDTLTITNNLARLYEARGQYEKARLLCTQVLEIQRRKLGGDHPRTAATMATLGLVLLKQQKYSEAASILRECLTIREAKLPDDWSRFYAQSLLGGSLLGQKAYTEAEPMLLAGYEGMSMREARVPARSKALLTGAGERVVQLYDAWGKKEKANEWRAKIKTISTLPANPFAP
jgi:eukaryotic-like serine/threonine-protein kinase